jgi:hypothetical protein
MDRDTIKNLLMTTSVVAIVAGTGHEAAAVVCDVNVQSQTQAFSLTTNVNCIVINNSTITSDVMIGSALTVGPSPGSGTPEIEISNSTLQGGLINNGTVFTTLIGGGALILNQGIDISGNSIVGNGVTNGATGVISIHVTNTDLGNFAEAEGTGVRVSSSKFAGNVTNQGTVDVRSLADPPGAATASAFGIIVTSTSFVGNVINTNVINAFATSLAGPGTALSSFANAFAEGISVVSPGRFAALTNASTSMAGFWLGNVANSGVITTVGTASDLANGGAATGSAFGLAVSRGIDVTGPAFFGNLSNTGASGANVALSASFTGNITNSNTISATATAFATATATTGTALATGRAIADGVFLGGAQFGGDQLGGIPESPRAISNTGSGNVNVTVLASLAANITNFDRIEVAALSDVTGLATTGTAIAATGAGAAGINVLGAGVQEAFSLTSTGNITNVLNETITGNISNAGTLGVLGSAIGTATSTGLALVTASNAADGILVRGLSTNGDVANAGAGNIVNTGNFSFNGNLTNSGLIEVFGLAGGSATSAATTGIASVVANNSVGGISLLGAQFSGNVSSTGGGSVSMTFRETFVGNIGNTGTIAVFGSAIASTVAGGTAAATLDSDVGGIRVIDARFNGTNLGFVNTNFAATFLGNISNSGTILAFSGADVDPTITSGTGVANVSPTANVAGIEVISGVSVFNVESFTFVGNVVNTGTIEAVALAEATVSGTPGAASTTTTRATADGILLDQTSIRGDITNAGGTIVAFAGASSQVINGLGQTNAFAFADGIHVDASIFNGNVGSSGVIRALGTAFSNDVAQAVATANGMLINAVSFVGNVSNTGGIFVTAAAQATSIGSTATAAAAGIDILNGATFTGSVTNGLGGGMLVSAVAAGDTLAGPRRRRASWSRCRTSAPTSRTTVRSWWRRRLRPAAPSSPTRSPLPRASGSAARRAASSLAPSAATSRTRA